MKKYLIFVVAVALLLAACKQTEPVPDAPETMASESPLPETTVSESPLSDTAAFDSAHSDTVESEKDTPNWVLFNWFQFEDGQSSDSREDFAPADTDVSAETMDADAFSETADTDHLNEIENSLIGFWHSSPDFSGGLKEWYRFYDYAEIDCTSAEGIFYSGSWDVTDGGVLELSLYGLDETGYVEEPMHSYSYVIESISSDEDGTILILDGKEFWKLYEPVDVIDGVPLYIDYRSDFDEEKYQNSEVLYISNPRTTGGNVVLSYDGDLYDFRIFVVVFDFADGSLNYHYGDTIFKKEHLGTNTIIDYESVDIGTSYAEGFSFCDASGTYHAYAMWHGGRGPELNVGEVHLSGYSEVAN